MAIRATGEIVDSWLASLATDSPLVESGRRLGAVLVDGRPILTGATWRARDTGGTADLAEYLPAGRTRARPLILVTGDEWTAPPFHSSVQWLVRMAVQSRARALDVDVAVIPFSALAGAGINRTSIRPLEIRPDRQTETLEPVSFELAELGTADSRSPLGTDSSSGYRYSWRLGDGRLIVRDETLETRRHDYASRPLDANGRPDWTAPVPVIVETFEPGTKVSAPDVIRPGRNLWNQSVRLDESTGAYVIVHRRHWLGDCLFTAETVTRRRRRRPWTVRDVIGTARRLCELESDELYRTSSGRLRRPDELAAGRDHIEPASARLASVDIDKPIAELVPVARRRRYLSSFDMNEPRGLYFLATLPSSSRARTVDMSLDDLAPASVHAALARGRDVARQGDIFAIETSLTDRDVAEWPRARLSLFTGHAGYSIQPKRGEPGYVAPLTRDERARLIARARRQWRLAFRALEPAGPSSGPRGARARNRTARDEWLSELERARARARSAVLNAGRARGVYGNGAEWTREAFERVRARGPAVSRPATRDGYRLNVNGSWPEPAGRALELWRRVCRDELERLRPALSGESQTRAVRDVARILSVHGTAHSASHVARGPGGTIYVKGTMRHVPALDRARASRDRDHINVRLGDGSTWYLAVRNTVPRSSDTAG